MTRRTAIPGALHGESRPARAFTLVEILISILILALGVLGLGALFPVIIREQRLGTDASMGVLISNNARTLLTQAEWGSGLPAIGGNAHPALGLGTEGSTQFLWNVLRRSTYYADAPHQAGTIGQGLARGYNPAVQNNFQWCGQGEWLTTVVDKANGTAKLGYPDRDSINGLAASGLVYAGATQVPAWVDLPVSQRLYPVIDGSQPRYVWDFAVQRVSDFDHRHSPDEDPVRAVVFVRGIDPRLRATGNAASIYDAMTKFAVGSPEFRLPVGEDANGNPTLDGTGTYSAIKTCEVVFYYNPSTPAMNHRDRLYIPTAWAGTLPSTQILARMWAQMRQPGQKLVDNLGNVYTVVGTGNEPNVPGEQNFDGVAGSDDLKIDPPVPEYVTRERAAPAATEAGTYANNSGFATRAIRQVAFTPQIPVSVTLVELAKGISP